MNAHTPSSTDSLVKAMERETHASVKPGRLSRSMGDILVETGRLSEANLAKILEDQTKNNIPFGEAAIALQLLTKEDIDYALSKQFDYNYLLEADGSLSPSLVAAYKPFSRVGENLRALRSQIMLRAFNASAPQKVLAVVSPGSGEGRSFISANLAIVFAQQGERTLLIDGDLRAKPESSQMAQFKLSRNAGLSGVLAGRAGLEAIQPVPSLQGLSVLAAGAPPPNPQELLGRPAFEQLLLSAAAQFDVVLIDTPSGNDFADAELIAAKAGAAILVTRANHSSLPLAASLVRRLQDGGVAVIGSVLNDA